MEMKSVGIYLKTYEGDFKWLPYLFRSIDKFVTGFDRMVITVDNPTELNLLKFIEMPKTIKVDFACVNRPKDFHGYVYQQYCKLLAFDYLHTNYIMYIDSDCVFKRPINPNDLFVDGKPIIYKTPYERIDSPWKQITEDAIGFPVEWEYMRRHPFTYHRSTLVELFRYKPGIYEYTKARAASRSFSEFNYIGAYAEKFESDKYHFHDTEYGLPDPFIHQLWSWGGVTEQVKNEIEEILK